MKLSNSRIKGALVSFTVLASTVIPVSATHAQLPPNSVVGGREADGTPLYLCSGIYNNGIHPGKVISQGYCNFGFGGVEIVLSSPSTFVVITNPSGAPWRWVNSSLGTPLPPTVLATGFENGSPLYVCRASYNGGIHPGKVIPAGYCNFGFGGLEILATDYQVLTR